MKRGSEYAKRVKQLYQRLIRKLGKPELPELTDPIHQLIVGILSENSAEKKAVALFQRICEQMVDLNELRVTPPMELADFIGNSVPQGLEKAHRVIRVLNEVRARQDALDLSFLRQRGRREAREYLESLDGVGSYAAASVMVHSLGGHAIPVDYLTIYVLRKENVVEESADRAEVQGFLERNVSAADARRFVTLLNRHVAKEGARVAVHRLPELLDLASSDPSGPKRNGTGKSGGGASDPIAALDEMDGQEGKSADLPSANVAAANKPAIDKSARRAGKQPKPLKKPKKPPPPSPAGRKSGGKKTKSKQRASSAGKKKG